MRSVPGITEALHTLFTVMPAQCLDQQLMHCARVLTSFLPVVARCAPVPDSTRCMLSCHLIPNCNAVLFRVRRVIQIMSSCCRAGFCPLGSLAVLMRLRFSQSQMKAPLGGDACCRLPSDPVKALDNRHNPAGTTHQQDPCP